MKLLTTFYGTEINRTQIHDIKDLNLPDLYTGDIEKTIKENRLLWEFWLESAPNYGTLKDRLGKRGYQKLPNRATTLHRVRPNRIIRSEEEKKPILPNIRNMAPKKQMVQRKSGR